MTLIDIILLLGLGIVITLLLWKNRGVTTDDSSSLQEHIGELTEKVRKTESERDELAGKGKILHASMTKLDAENKILGKQVAAYEATEKKREEQFTLHLQQLEAAKQALTDERLRVQHEDEERLRQEEEERDRIWAEHEQTVIDRITNLCKQPQYAFTCFTNTNLPEGFNVKPKPDCLIEFLDQYIVFDAKKSKSESLKAYIDRTIKDTVEKFKKQPKIASTVFLVVPTEALGELKSHHFVHEGYTFFVVSTEALAPILASLKKITTYEFADQMDPQQRENIVQYIAEMDFHINLQNATNIILTKHGTELLEKAHAIDPEIAEEVALKKQPMNTKASIAAADLKKLVTNLTEQNLEIQQIVSPKASVKKKNLKAAEGLILESML